MSEAPLEQAVPVGAPVLGHLRSASAAAAAAARDEEGRAGKAFASGEIGRVLLPASWLSLCFYGAEWKRRWKADRGLPGVSRGVVWMRRRVPEYS